MDVVNSVLGLLRVVGEAGGGVTLPVGELDSQHRPHQHRAVAERRPRHGQLVQEAPDHLVTHEVHVIPREPIVHDVRADNLDQPASCLAPSPPGPPTSHSLLMTPATSLLLTSAWSLVTRASDA